MVKPAFILKRTHNMLLDMLADWDLTRRLPSENELARRMDVSRTTMRSAVRSLGEQGLLMPANGGMLLARRPQASDYFNHKQTIGPRELVERSFMQQILRNDCIRPGSSAWVPDRLTP